MLIIADENIPEAQAAFSRFGEVRVLPGRRMSSDDVRHADILLVRSVTRVNEPLLAGSQVRFVGSATIGTDHVDLAWLVQQDITFANAPGCNAISAAEYVMSALLVLAEENGLDLQQMTMGIIGCGNVGSRVKLRAEALGMKCLVCDPPRAEAEGQAGFVAMQAIAQCDIVTVHVPLVIEGKYPTLQLVDTEFLEQLPAGTIFINTSRGDVVDEIALLEKALAQPDIRLVLDVWENEPSINQELVKRAVIATPHIAGYSVDGKIRATAMLYKALCDFLGEPAGTPDWAEIPPPVQASIMIGKDNDRQAVMRQCLVHVYDVRRDDQMLRHSMKMAVDERAAEFDRLRKHYWPRRECGAYQVSAENIAPDIVEALEVYGFTVA